MNSEHSHMAASSIAHSADMAKEAIQQAAWLYAEPSAIYRPKIYIDGDHWCALYGDNLQDGVAGFGKSPAQAMNDFNANWHKELDR